MCFPGSTSFVNLVGGDESELRELIGSHISRNRHKYKHASIISVSACVHQCQSGPHPARRNFPRRTRRAAAARRALRPTPRARARSPAPRWQVGQPQTGSASPGTVSCSHHTRVLSHVLFRTQAQMTICGGPAGETSIKSGAPRLAADHATPYVAPRMRARPPPAAGSQTPRRQSDERVWDELGQGSNHPRVGAFHQAVSCTATSPALFNARALLGERGAVKAHKP